jgi:hypothetical protein
MISKLVEGQSPEHFKAERFHTEAMAILLKDMPKVEAEIDFTLMVRANVSFTTGSTVEAILDKGSPKVMMQIACPVTDTACCASYTGGTWLEGCYAQGIQEVSIGTKTFTFKKLGVVQKSIKAGVSIFGLSLGSELSTQVLDFTQRGIS